MAVLDGKVQLLGHGIRIRAIFVPLGQVARHGGPIFKWHNLDSQKGKQV